MTGLMVGLLLAVTVLVLVIALLAEKIATLSEDVRYLTDDAQADHAMCIAHVAEMTSRRVVAMALRDAARRYDSGSEKANLAAMRANYVTDGPSVPALWMDQQANLLEGSGR